MASNDNQSKCIPRNFLFHINALVMWLRTLNNFAITTFRLTLDKLCIQYHIARLSFPFQGILNICFIMLHHQPIT